VAEGVELVRFVQSLSAAPSLEQLARRFLAGFGRVIGADIYGYNLGDPVADALRWYTGANVSDAFLVRYGLHGRPVDPILARAMGKGLTTYNRAIMSARDWRESPVYRHAYRLHGIQHIVEVPLRIDGRILGNLHFGTTERDFGGDDLQTADAIGGVIAATVDAIDARAHADSERDVALAALELSLTPIVISGPGAPDARRNAAANRLLADVVDSDVKLYGLLARPGTNGGFSRRLEVELVTGESAMLHAHSSPAPSGDQLITVLELEREHAGIAPGRLAALTPREQEVAVLVVDGLADREIAERLHLSHHTVSQYVRRIYRKLNVDSRVALTRLLLGPRNPTRRS
jgi:DNA-binding CsgD family transcriptional regulator